MFDVLHEIWFIQGVISIFRFTLFLFTPNDFEKFTCLFQFLLCYTWRERKRNICGFILMYKFENVTWNAMFYFSFLSHFCLFAFRCFSSCWKIRVLTRFLINYFLFSTPLHLPIFISSSAFLFLIERVSCINIHVQNNFNFFSLSLSLSLKQFFQFLPTLESISIQYYYFFPTILEIYTRTLF